MFYIELLFPLLFLKLLAFLVTFVCLCFFSNTTTIYKTKDDKCFNRNEKDIITKISNILGEKLLKLFFYINLM